MEKNYLGDNYVSGKSVTAEHVKSQAEDGGRDSSSDLKL